MTITTGRSTRFRGRPMGRSILQLSAALVIAALISLTLTGLFTPWALAAFFAIGAGAGYSLSGSV